MVSCLLFVRDHTRFPRLLREGLSRIFLRLFHAFGEMSEPLCPRHRPRGRNVAGCPNRHRVQGLSRNYGMRCLSRIDGEMSGGVPRRTGRVRRIVRGPRPEAVPALVARACALVGLLDIAAGRLPAVPAQPYAHRRRGAAGRARAVRRRAVAQRRRAAAAARARAEARASGGPGGPPWCCCRPARWRSSSTGTRSSGALISVALLVAAAAATATSSRRCPTRAAAGARSRTSS